MKVSKKVIIPAATVVCLGGGTLLGAGLASAASGQPGSLAQQIASDFHLNASQVQSVVNLHRGDAQAARYNRVKAKLDAAVTAGKLTPAQETTILGFLSTRQADMKLTGSARKQALAQLRQQVKAFLQANPSLKQYVHRG